MYKLNVLPVSFFEKQISKNGMLFSHEPCDVCSSQGIVYEAVSYKDNFDYTKFRYANVTAKRYKDVADPANEATVTWLHALTSSYIIYYVCSKECATMLQFQLGE